MGSLKTPLTTMKFTFRIKTAAHRALIAQAYERANTAVKPYAFCFTKKPKPLKGANLYLVKDAGVYLICADTLHKDKLLSWGDVKCTKAEGSKPKTNPVVVYSDEGEDFHLGGDDFVEAVFLPTTPVGSRIESIVVDVLPKSIKTEVVFKLL